MATDVHWISEPAATSFVFGPFRLFPTQRLLTKADKPVNLGSRAFDLLIALVERPGELVSKDELMTRVWPNTFVEPANLAVHMSALRRVLGDGRSGNRYVVNIPGRGYRFVAPVTVDKRVPSAIAAGPSREQTLPDFMEAGAPAELVSDLAQQPHRRRLLAILGPNGIGKSTLALAAVEKLIATHGDGVWLINLGSVDE